MYTCDGCSGQGMLTDQIKTRPTKHVSRGSKPRQAKGGESRSRAAEKSETKRWRLIGEACRYVVPASSVKSLLSDVFN